MVQASHNNKIALSDTFNVNYKDNTLTKLCPTHVQQMLYGVHLFSFSDSGVGEDKRVIF